MGITRLRSYFFSEEEEGCEEEEALGVGRRDGAFRLSALLPENPVGETEISQKVLRKFPESYERDF